MPNPALTPSSNFLTLYLHAAGRSVVPHQFHVWSALSLLSAAVADQVGYWRYKTARLNPNLYVWLVSNSGAGKGVAIQTAMNLAELTPQVNLYQGSITRAALQDMMADKLVKGPAADKPVRSWSKVWLVAPEMAAAFPGEAQAVDMCTFMTLVYEGSRQSLGGDTRTSGPNRITKPHVNWLCGTTTSWMRMAVPHVVLEGGFVGRLVPVWSDAPIPRIRVPEYPKDVNRVNEWLKERVLRLADLSGDFEVSPQADKIWAVWFESRPDPVDEREREWWNKEDNLILKVAMLCSVADNDSLVVTAAHMVQAQHLVAMVRGGVRSFLDAVAETPETTAMRRLRDFIQGCGETTRSAVIRQGERFGMDLKRIDGALTMLQAGHRIRIHPNGKGESVVTWVVRGEGGVSDAEAPEETESV